MRIILTVTTDLNYDQRMQRICTSLHQAGYEVCLIGRKKKNSLELTYRPYRQLRLNCFFQTGKWLYLEYNVRLFFRLLITKATIFNAVDLDSILAVTLAGRLRNKKLIYDAHEYFTEVPEVVDRPRIKKMWERVANYCIPKMDVCYTVGPKLAEIFETQYNKPFGVVRNVPFQESGKEFKIPIDRIIFYQGALNAGRGLETMIQVMEKLPEKFKLWIAGEGDLSQELRRQVKYLKLEDQVTFFGFILPEKLKEITPKSWLGLNLLENRGQSYYYSLANKAFDYVQAGVPSLQMDFPEYQTLQKEYPCFILLEDLSVEPIYKAIIGLDEDEANYKTIQGHCLLASDGWNWEKEEEVLINLWGLVR